jgi:hypothetical protein
MRAGGKQAFASLGSRRAVWSMAALCALLLAGGEAVAQGRWDQNNQDPFGERGRGGAYDQGNGQPQDGYPGQQDGAYDQGNAQGGAYQGQGQGAYNNPPNRCQELERQLVSEWQNGQAPQDAVGRIDQQLGQFRDERRKLEVEAERRECYEELFIFGRSLKRTPACIQIDGNLERLRRDIDNLKRQRDGMTNSARKRERRDDLVAELARNGCGENYQREATARRRPTGPSSFFSLWQDEETPFDRGYANTAPEQSNLPFASYRTMCVRLCDGFYFPVSFSTLGSRFPEDEAKCKDQCAAPAELFVYKNPGEEIEQMVSLAGAPYTGLKNAFRNRKEYVKGCSCRPEEYSAQQIETFEQDRKKQANAAPAGGSGQRNDAQGGQTAPAQ